MEKKLAVVETYLNYEQLDGGRPSILKVEGSAVEAGEAGAETDLVAIINLKGRKAGATTNLVALALDLILALNLEDREARAATDLSTLALYLRGVTALNVTPHQ
jgi:hypothetical protein